jgi:hypothetical protein
VPCLCTYILLFKFMYLVGDTGLKSVTSSQHYEFAPNGEV